MDADQDCTQSSTWSVGQLARASGLSVRVLRHWEDKGLLQADRSTRGHRRYRPDQVTRPYSVGAALAVAAQSDASLAGAVRAAAEAGSLDGLAAGCLVAAGVALAGAVLAWPGGPCRPGLPPNSRRSVRQWLPRRA